MEIPLSSAQVDNIARWMQMQGLGDGPLTDLTSVGGGTQNVMVRFSRDGADYVLRRGPVHLRPVSNTVIARETQILRALADTDVPHPRLVAACDDSDVLDGAVFYLMEPIDGFNASQELPEPHASDPEIQRGMSASLIDAIAGLGAVDHVAVGLGSFGKPEGFLERQVGRWRHELDTYAASFEGYDGPDLPEIEPLTAWLDAHRPSQWTPGIMHGDFHAANAMFSRSSADVAAVVDWEMATIGDPLLDLGWLVATWRLPDAPSIFGGPFMESPHVGTARDLVERYAAQTSRDLGAFDWYVVLACFKLGILLEGTYARSCAGQAPRDVGRELHQVTTQLLARGLEAAQGSW